VADLQQSMKKFLKLCQKALELNSTLIGQDQIAFQEACEEGFKKLKKLMSEYLPGTKKESKKTKRPKEIDHVSVSEPTSPTFGRRTEFPPRLVKSPSDMSSTIMPNNRPTSPPIKVSNDKLPTDRPKDVSKGESAHAKTLRPIEDAQKKLRSSSTSVSKTLKSKSTEEMKKRSNTSSQGVLIQQSERIKERQDHASHSSPQETIEDEMERIQREEELLLREEEELKKIFAKKVNEDPPPPPSGEPPPPPPSDAPPLPPRGNIDSPPIKLRRPSSPPLYHSLS